MSTVPSPSLDADSVEPRTRSSSILYALGKLEEATSGHREAIRDLREAQERLPEKIGQMLAPQLTTLTSTVNSHGVRLTALEKRQWVWMGGATVLATIAGFASKELIPVLVPIIFHVR